MNIKKTGQIRVDRFVGSRVVDIRSVVPYRGVDNSIIRDFLGDRLGLLGSTVNTSSLAIAHLLRGQATVKHHHDKSDEIYFMLEGRGRMTLGNAVFNAHPGQAILIQRGTPHKIENLGRSVLSLLCFCIPDFHESDVLFDEPAFRDAGEEGFNDFPELNPARSLSASISQRFEFEGQNVRFLDSSSILNARNRVFGDLRKQEYKHRLNPSEFRLHVTELCHLMGQDIRDNFGVNMRDAILLLPWRAALSGVFAWHNLGISPDNIWHLGIRRIETQTGEPETYFEYLPETLKRRGLGRKQLIIFDPVVWTGKTAVAVIAHAINKGFSEKNIIINHIMPYEEAVSLLSKTYPHCNIVIPPLYSDYHPSGRARPNLSDFGDCLFASISTEEAVNLYGPFMPQEALTALKNRLNP